MAKVLLVEDDPMISEIYKKKFEESGIEFDLAVDGKDVLSKVKKGSYDLVLLDLVLPEMGGMDVLKELRKDKGYDQKVKIVVLSNLVDEKDKAFENGADGFMPKSQFTPSELVAEIERMLNQYKEQEKNEARGELGSEAESQIAGQNNQNKKKILFIEDEEMFLEMFGEKLKLEGYEVEIAKNGAWGVKEAMSKDFDLIIMDMVMPAMTGIEMAKKIKREEKTKNIPIIVLSASARDDEEKEMKKMGVSDFFVKTRITPSDLTRRVSEILGN